MGLQKYGNTEGLEGFCFIYTAQEVGSDRVRGPVKSGNNKRQKEDNWIVSGQKQRKAWSSRHLHPFRFPITSGGVWKKKKQRKLAKKIVQSAKKNKIVCQFHYDKIFFFPSFRFRFRSFLLKSRFSSSFGMFIFFSAMDKFEEKKFFMAIARSRSESYYFGYLFSLS